MRGLIPERCAAALSSSRMVALGASAIARSMVRRLRRAWLRERRLETKDISDHSFIGCVAGFLLFRNLRLRSQLYQVPFGHARPEREISDTSVGIHRAWPEYAESGGLAVPLVGQHDADPLEIGLDPDPLDVAIQAGQFVAEIVGEVEHGADVGEHPVVRQPMP